MVDLTLRETKGSVLTHTEMDTNLTNLKNAINRSVNINQGLVWSEGGVYTYGALVRYNGIAYICIANATSELPTNTNDWQPVGKGTYSVPELTDVMLTNSTNGETLVYNATLNKWQNKKIVNSFKMNFSGFLVPIVSDVRYYPTANITVKSYAVTIASSSNIAGVLVVKKNDLTILTISVPANTNRIGLTPFTTTLTPDEYLTVDSNLVSGRDLSITFTYE